ncbi:hypothetical protein GIB67_040742 [Kingdonia uniflora]|uniref:AP2/ERF domain-containing protein n=1 Tax=Kingdonia uniflora TaxID=39325 RepID=A0A7J7KUG2_9MAGN|nr:hypothetical protein GIB67_040742 [Kingdonia uniflora]
MVSLAFVLTGCNFPVELPGFESFDIGSKVSENPSQNNSATPPPVPSADLGRQSEVDVPKLSSTSSISGSNSPKKEQIHHFSGPEIKRRKRHRRKLFEDQEPCIMRGVYLKNMKWQAAIKVDKRQIHLGTVGSQEEAARLYDRAAFMCGREPNFELSEEEKRELIQLDWEEFLVMTRSTISSKKNQRRLRSGAEKKPKVETPMQSNDYEDEEENNARIWKCTGDFDIFYEDLDVEL